MLDGISNYKSELELNRDLRALALKMAQKMKFNFH